MLSWRRDQDIGGHGIYVYGPEIFQFQPQKG